MGAAQNFIIGKSPSYSPSVIKNVIKRLKALVGFELFDGVERQDCIYYHPGGVLLEEQWRQSNFLVRLSELCAIDEKKTQVRAADRRKADKFISRLQIETGCTGAYRSTSRKVWHHTFQIDVPDILADKRSKDQPILK